MARYVLAIVAPGQGAQKPGMLGSWLQADGVAEQAAAMSQRAHLDLVRLGTTAGADEIKDTAVTQPLVVATALLAAGTMGVPAGAVTAGHSVGELAAAAIAGVLSPLDAVDLAAVRGSAMGAACALTPTGMSAVLGGEPETVLSALAELDLVGANVNGGGQIVAAGATSALETLAANPPAGARVLPLPVAGAFHTAYMAGAEAALAEHVAGPLPRRPDPAAAHELRRLGGRLRSYLPAAARRAGDAAGPLGPLYGDPAAPRSHRRVGTAARGHAGRTRQA